MTCVSEFNKPMKGLPLGDGVGEWKVEKEVHERNQMEFRIDDSLVVSLSNLLSST